MGPPVVPPGWRPGHSPRCRLVWPDREHHLGLVIRKGYLRRQQARPSGSYAHLRLARLRVGGTRALLKPKGASSHSPIPRDGSIGHLRSRERRNPPALSRGRGRRSRGRRRGRSWNRRGDKNMSGGKSMREVAGTVGDRRTSRSKSGSRSRSARGRWSLTESRSRYGGRNRGRDGNRGRSGGRDRGRKRRGLTESIGRGNRSRRGRKG